MKPHASRCKCLHCKMIFVPDYRNRGRQKYCSGVECQAASKQTSQRQWLSKPGNRDYFRGPENVQRVTSAVLDRLLHHAETVIIDGIMPRAELCRAEAHLPSEREGHRAA